MDERVFKAIFVVLLLASMLIRGPYVLKHRKGVMVVSRTPGKQGVLVGVAAIGIMVVPLIHVFSPWLSRFDLAMPTWGRLIGAVGFGMTIALYRWSHKTLDRNWSNVLEIRQDHELITAGPYKHVRHPLYAAFWLWVIFQGPLLSNAAVWLVGIVTWAVTYFLRVADEEEMMLNQFGLQYEEYMEKTGRLWPRLS